MRFDAVLVSVLNSFCLSFIFSCGTDFKSGDDSYLSHNDSVPNSYIVAFCPSEKKSRFPFLSFQEETHYLENFSFQGIEDERIKEHSFISTFHNESSSFKSSCKDFVIGQIDFHSSEDAFALLKSWKHSGRIAFWEENAWNTLSDFDASNLNLYADEGRRWWTDTIHLFPALEYVEEHVRGKEIISPVIAVLDGGIDHLHPALKGKIWENPHASSLCPNDRWGCNTVEADRGYLGIGDAHPYGTDSAGEMCNEYGLRVREGDCMHATHIAGIIAGNVEKDIPGVCPYCKVMNLRVLENVDGYGRISDSAVLRALKYLSLFERAPGKNLVRVVNLSFGKYQKGKAVALYIDSLSKLRDGIVVVAAGGNEDSQRRIYPAAYTSVIGVVGLAASGRKASYSNYGSWLNIAAPGGEIREGRGFAIQSSIPGGGISNSQGTSMASPIVAGVLGLMLTINPDLSYQDLREGILNSSDHSFYRADFADGYNYRNYYPVIDGQNVPLLGLGILDASAAVQGIKKQKSTVKQNQRVQLHCASIFINRDSTSMNMEHLFFLTPLFFVLILQRKERKRNLCLANLKIQSPLI